MLYDNLSIHDDYLFSGSTTYWQSPVSGIRYPISWDILIPEKNIKLFVSTPIKQQEWSKAGGFSFNYWEGSIDVNGNINQQPVSGSGYLEMTGYD
ncbi:MAG: lipocalin family protein [gamma proteobacterium symbiont of Lucinoma myriamae]|nr:lipocalin family protein [gamma proteobacterium symbiont of Lucinoma myriamae]MCU7817457.1 lipocalin family protein [gamma proteobacterium symbiont of Lucinoma myriamae]MCU7831827.1 lipocalin family protein [gamma proteobacterium symbiont of Lucinoma myriamae]